MNQSEVILAIKKLKDELRLSFNQDKLVKLYNLIDKLNIDKPNNE